MSKKNHVGNYLKGPNLRYVVANKNPNKTEKLGCNIYLIKVIIFCATEEKLLQRQEIM